MYCKENRKTIYLVNYTKYKLKQELVAGWINLIGKALNENYEKLN